MAKIIIFFCSIIFIFFSTIFSQSLENRLRVPLYFTLKSSFGYDSNYLKLSNKEQNEIVYYPSLLGDSESISSFILKNIIEVKYSPYLIGMHESQIRIKIGYNKYFESSNKSFSTFGIYFAQHIGKYEWIKLSYSFIPKFYLRDYRDRDDIVINENTDVYLTSCLFSQGSTTFKYSKWLFIKRTWLEGIINYKTQYFNRPFIEFDLDILSIGAQFHSRYFKEYYVKLAGYQVFANNITFQNGLLTTTDIDRSFKQNDISISVRAKISYFDQLDEIGIYFGSSTRNYSSNEITDYLHNGRTHIENRIKFWIGNKINNDMRYTAHVISRIRTTDAAAEWIEDLKSFEKWEYLLSFSYYFSSDILY